MADYKVTDTQLTSVANAIRAKTGKSAQIEFPTEFVSEIGSISGGGDDIPIIDGAHELISKNGLVVLSTDFNKIVISPSGLPLTAYAVIELNGTSASGSNNHAVLLNSISNWGTRTAPAFYVFGGSQRQLMCNAFNDDAPVGIYTDGDKFVIAYSIASDGTSNWFSSLGGTRLVAASSNALSNWKQLVQFSYSGKYNFNGSEKIYYMSIVPGFQENAVVIENINKLLQAFD